MGVPVTYPSGDVRRMAVENNAMREAPDVIMSGRRHHASGEPISRTRPFPGVRMTLHPAHFAIDPSAVAVDLRKAPGDPERPHRASTTPEGQKRIRRNSVGP